MRFKNVFCTQLYKDTFSKVLKQDEFTHGDEILVDMEEPDGDRISYIIMHHGHSISDCKAFVATTDENVLVALFEDRKSTRLNSSHIEESRMPSSA